MSAMNPSEKKAIGLTAGVFDWPGEDNISVGGAQRLQLGPMKDPEKRRRSYKRGIMTHAQLPRSLELVRGASSK